MPRFSIQGRKGNKESLSAISNLALELCKPLESVLSKVFPSSSSKEEVCDKIRNEWRVYQMELIPESAYTTNDVAACSTSRGRQQVSYWEKAFQLADLPVISVQASSGLDIDKLIAFLEDVIDDNGLSKFAFITSLFKIIASLSHGNSAPENGFSINKHMLQLHGTSLSAETIEALRFVKDTILSFGGILNIPITKNMLEKAKLAYSRYQAELEAKRQLQKEEDKIKKANEVEVLQKQHNEAERNMLIASIQQVSNQFQSIE